MPKDVSTFKRGGVHPKDLKQFSNSKKLERLPIPSLVVVSLSQHLGAPAKPLKKVGETVLKGEKIGTSSNFISAEVHSPISGVIKKIIKQRLANSVVADAFVIEKDEEAEDVVFEKVDYSGKSEKELLETIKDLGVVGLGGATFPTHVKLMIPRGKFVEHLVINGVECEPYLTSDHRIMLDRSEEVLEGIMITKKISKAKKVIIGIEENKMDAVEHLTSLIKEKNYPIEVQPLKLKYPQGDEKQLLKATINKEIPSGKLPLDVGAVVVNIGTCFAIYEACAFNKPLIDRVVCVSGECIENPKNLIVPIGTATSQLIDYCGGFKTDPDKIISGGAMMGFSFPSLDIPIVKGTSGVISIMDGKKVRETPCISCGKCVEACPIGLMPTLLYRNIKNGNYQVALDDYSLMDCKECGCCAFVCPAHIPLVHSFKTGKKLARKKK